jgi:benzaldehyde dehydrogenase (NAD)
VLSASVGRYAIGNRVQTGLLQINDQTVADEPHVPFSGVGLAA